MDCICVQSNEARMAVDILLRPKSLARFEFQNLAIEDSSSPPEGLYFNSTSFADTSITFSAKVFFEKTDDPEWGYRSTGFEALDVHLGANLIKEANCLETQLVLARRANRVEAGIG